MTNEYCNICRMNDECKSHRYSSQPPIHSYIACCPITIFIVDRSDT